MAFCLGPVCTRRSIKSVGMYADLGNFSKGVVMFEGKNPQSIFSTIAYGPGDTAESCPLRQAAHSRASNPRSRDV